MSSEQPDTGGRVCMTCGLAIADDDGSAMAWAEGDAEGLKWARWFHRDCADAVTRVVDALWEQRDRIELDKMGAERRAHRMGSA